VSANATYLATIWVIPLIIAITIHEAARPHRPSLRRLLGRRVSAAREQSGRNVRGGREPATPRFSSLKVHLRPKSGNESVPSNPAHIGIVLNHRLNQQGSRKHQDVELNTGRATTVQFPPAVPAVGEIWLPGGRLDYAVAFRDEYVQLVRAARHGADERALRRRHAADAPPSVPPNREVRLPSRCPDSAVGTDDEDIEFVETARYGRDRSAGRRAATQRNSDCRVSQLFESFQRE